MIHQPFCVRKQDHLGRWWHTALCETREQNAEYATLYGDAAFSKALVEWLFG